MKKMRNILLLVVAMLFMPAVVFAEEASINYEDIKANGTLVNGWSSDENIITYNMDNAKNYEFKVVGNNLNEDEQFTITLKSDYKDFKKVVTGRELMDGVVISQNDGNGRMIAKVTNSSNEAITIQNPAYSTIKTAEFYFNDNFKSEALDNLFKKMAPNGTISIDAVKPSSEVFYESVISYSLRNKYGSEYDMFGDCYEGKCSVYLIEPASGRMKSYDVKYTFTQADEKVKKEVDKYVKNFNVSQDDIENKLETMDDLETISYKVIAGKNFDIDLVNSIINYSSEFQKKLGNSNLVAALDTRAGWDDEFTSGGFGFLNLIYDGIVYGSAEAAGVKQNNVIYISDNTKDDTDSYIKAATDRIKKYLPNVKVSIKRAGKISDLNFDGAIITLDKIVDVKKTLGEYYKVTLNGDEYSFFIAKDSSKMKTPVVSTQDLKTDITITSTDSSVPLDTKITANLYAKNSKEHKEFLSKLKLNKGLVVDLKLFSNLANSYIKKLENGNFKVYIPLTSELKNINLSAYYIAENGKVEEYKITKENGYAVFETNHFSTYTVGASTKLNAINPPTYDNVNIYILLMLISMTLLIVIGKEALVKIK